MNVNPPSKTIGILLAAGKSSRMGSCKLSLPFPKEPLGLAALSEIMKSKIDYLIIVQHTESTWLNPTDLESFPKERWECIICPQAHLGQSYSLKTGLLRARQLSADAVIIFLADQPFITADMVNQLLYKTDHDIYFVAYSENSIKKPPVLFHKKAFDLLFTLKGDEGARRLLNTKAFKGTTIEMCSINLFDIDTLKDYEFAMSVRLNYTV